jgi:hypothetical protein
MSIIGFNFTKVNVERNEGSSQKINVQNNIGIKNVEEATVNFAGGNSKALKFTFFFHCAFQPDVGHINLDGEIIALFDNDEGQKVLDEWKDKKHIPASQATKVLNVALNKAQIMALLLSKEVNLPAPVQLPKVQPKPAEGAQ